MNLGLKRITQNTKFYYDISIVIVEYHHQKASKTNYCIENMKRRFINKVLCEIKMNTFIISLHNYLYRNMEQIKPLR